MHTRRLDGVEATDAARQLGLEGALEVDLLLELGLTERVLVEQLHARARGGLATQAHASRRKASLLNLAARNSDDDAIGQLVGDLALLELGDDGGAVLVGQALERDPQVRRAAGGGDEEQQA